MDASKIPFEPESSIKFINNGENPDWKDLKAHVAGIVANPFLAFPPGSKSGSIAKGDGTVFSDEEMTKLKDAKILFGGVEVEWARMSGE